MEIIKNKDGSTSYRESIYINGKKVHSPRFSRKTDASTWKIREQSEKDKKKLYGEEYVSSNKKFEEYALEWLENHAKLNCVQKTYLAYRSVVMTHLLPRFSNLTFKEITEAHGIKLMNDLKKSHNPKGVNNIWGVMKGIISCARKDKIIRNDPFEFIKRPALNLREDKFWIKTEATQFLRANINDPLYGLYFTAIHTGMRLGELCGLCWDRVDFSRNQISVTRTRDKLGLKETTKTKSKRIVPIVPELRALLLQLHEKNIDSKFVFSEIDKTEVKYAHVYRRFKKAQKNARLINIIRFHDTRHTFASNFMMNGGSLFDLQKILGHTKIEMTMRYAHFSPEHLQGSIAFMSMTNDDRPVLDLQETVSEEKLVMLRI